MGSLTPPLTMASLSTSSQCAQYFTYAQFAPDMPKRRPRRIAKNGAVFAMSNADATQDDKPTKLVTFLGKGGSGKTTSAIFAAQHYAMAGLKTCLVIHSQDPTAEYLLNCKIGTSPMTCGDNLSAVRLETTKMILGPLNRLKEADSRLNMTQGVLEGVVGEELGVLPGMDSIFSAIALARFLKILGNMTEANSQKDKFDIVVYDGMSSEETLRILGATSKARLYLKYIRSLAEKTDLGRLAGPSLLRLVDEALNLSGRRFHLNGSLSSEIWDRLEQTIEKGSSIFTEPHKFVCYLVMDPSSSLSLNTALRYWGCAIQAGLLVSGALGIASPTSQADLVETVKSNFAPLPFALVPHLSLDGNLDWKRIMLNVHSEDAKRLLTSTGDKMSVPPSIKFDSAKRSVTLLMPGFNKSEIKLYQRKLNKWQFTVDPAKSSSVEDLSCWSKLEIRDALFISLLKFKERLLVPSLQTEVLSS